MDEIAEKAVDLWTSMGRETREVDFFGFLEGFRGGCRFAAHKDGLVSMPASLYDFMLRSTRDESIANERKAVVRFLREVVPGMRGIHPDTAYGAALGIELDRHHETIQAGPGEPQVTPAPGNFLDEREAARVIFKSCTGTTPTTRGDAPIDPRDASRQESTAFSEREAFAAWLDQEFQDLFREGDVRYADYVRSLARAIRAGDHHATLQDAPRQESTPGEEVKGDSVTSMPEVKPPGGTSG